MVGVDNAQRAALRRFPWVAALVERDEGVHNDPAELKAVYAAVLCQRVHPCRVILAEAGLGMENVVKTTVMLADMADFAEMNAVYAEFFTAPFPARSAFAVKALPKGARVEIECLAVR